MADPSQKHPPNAPICFLVTGQSTILWLSLATHASACHRMARVPPREDGSRTFAFPLWATEAYPPRQCTLLSVPERCLSPQGLSAFENTINTLTERTSRTSPSENSPDASTPRARSLRSSHRSHHYYHLYNGRLLHRCTRRAHLRRGSRDRPRRPRDRRWLQPRQLHHRLSQVRPVSWPYPR